MKLIERDAPLQALRQAQDEVATGSDRIVLLSGEAGISKSALVDHFLHDQSPPWRIIWAACDNLFAPRPLGPVYDIAAQLQGELARCLRRQRRSFCNLPCLSGRSAQTGHTAHRRHSMGR